MAEQRGARVLVLAGEPVAAPAGDDVDGIAHVEDALVRLVDLAVRPVREPRLRQGPEHGHVAEPAVGLLEVRLDEVGQIALPGMRALTDSRSSGSRVRTLARQSCAVDRAALTTSASPATCVRSSSPMAAERSSDATVLHSATVRTLWSSRTPASQIGYQSRSAKARPPCRTGPRVVHEDEVVVAQRPTVASGQRADRGECDAVVATAGAGLAPEALQPAESELCDRPSADAARPGCREIPRPGEVQSSCRHIAHGPRRAFLSKGRDCSDGIRPAVSV